MPSKSKATGGGVGTPNWKNRTLFHGDNLEVMRGMNSNTVHLIATDPPFKKGRDFHATPESLASGASFQDRWSWERDAHEEWLDKMADEVPDVMEVIQGSRKSYGDDMGAFLCFMAVRLLEMHRILRPDGSLFLHCDPTASHYLKELLDAVFGRKNFLNEIVWSYRSGGGSKRHFGRKHDIIFWYAKDKNRSYTFNTDEVRVPYDAVIAKSRKGLFNPKGKVSGDVWDISRPRNGSKEFVGFPTQKPLDLYKKIVLAASNKGDIVLDPFCGCATTSVAAEHLDREWVGIDIWDKAHEVVIDRLRKEGLVAGDGELATDGQVRITFGEIHYEKSPPDRTDDGSEAAPKLKVKESVLEPPGKKMSRAEMLEYLLSKEGIKCQGCNRVFDHEAYLQLDHNTPRSDGGMNHITNRVLLCGPCNLRKSNLLTLSGLRKKNTADNFMAEQS